MWPILLHELRYHTKALGYATLMVGKGWASGVCGRCNESGVGFRWKNIIEVEMVATSKRR